MREELQSLEDRLNPQGHPICEDLGHVVEFQGESCIVCGMNLACEEEGHLMELVFIAQEDADADGLVAARAGSRCQRCGLPAPEDA